MLPRHHVVAALGVSPEAFESFLETPGQPLGAWRASICAEVSGRDTAVLDWRLALLSRRTGALVLRASTVENRYVVLAVQRDGRYVALFDHPLGGLERELAAEVALDLDAPVAASRLEEMFVRDDEILARLHAGETPRHASTTVIRNRAAELAAELSAAGATGVDQHRLREALAGVGADAVVEHIWANLARVLDAMGLPGIERLFPDSDPATGPGRDGGEEAEDDAANDASDEAGSVEEDAGPTIATAADPSDENVVAMHRWSRAGRLGCVALPLLMAAGAVAGALMARRYDSLGATVGGAVLGLVAPVALVVGAFAAWVALGAARFGLVALRARRQQSREPPADRARWAQRLSPASAGAARRAIAAWSELRDELDASSARPADVAASRYSDVFLPRGRGSRELLARLEEPGGTEALGPALAELRLELLDRRLASDPVDDLTERFRGLLDSQS